MTSTEGTGSWPPTSEADIRRMVGDGLLVESHSFDAKEAMPRPGKNKDLARDMAAMALDGGFLLIGLAEDGTSGTFSPHPIPTANMRERIEAVAASAIDPPLGVQVTRIPSNQTSPEGEPLGYLLIEIAPSPRAPHQVDFVYYGRGESSNRPLSDAEVQRFHATRASQASRGRILLNQQVDRDPIPASQRLSGHLSLIAEPVSAAPDTATAFLRQTGIEEWIQQHTALADAPGLASGDRMGLEFLGQMRRRSDGWATTTAWLGAGRSWNIRQDEPTYEQYLMEIEFLNGGGIRCLIGQITQTDRNLQKYVLDRRIVAFTRRLVRWVADYGQAIGYRGSWLLGIHVNGIRAHQSLGFSGTGAVYTHPRPHAPTYSPPTYSEDTYERIATATTQEILARPGDITGQLVRDLTWALGSTEHHADIFAAPDPISSPEE